MRGGLIKNSKTRSSGTCKPTFGWQRTDRVLEQSNNADKNPMKLSGFALTKIVLFVPVFCGAFLLFSCSTVSTVPKGPDISSIPSPERPLPELPLRILGSGLVPAETLAGFLRETNPQADKDQVEQLAAFYAEEAAAEGVNHDIAFAQMCLETGFLRYGGLVTPDMNNFCGLGAIGAAQPGERFPEPRIGVRAHIQHLKAYATDSSLNRELVDPRYRWVRYGSAPTFRDLSGTWATDREYGDKIESILERLYRYSYPNSLNEKTEPPAGV
jgi:hypothetical protein